LMGASIRKSAVADVADQDQDNGMLFEVSPFLNVSVARRNHFCSITAVSTLNAQLGWELDFVVDVGSEFQTAALLRWHRKDGIYRAHLDIPTEAIELIKGDDNSTATATATVSLRATLGALIDTRDAHLWPNEVTERYNADLAPFVDLVWKQRVSLAVCLVDEDEIGDGTDTETETPRNTTCGFLNGREPGQGWWSDDVWLPEGKAGCQLAATPPKRSRVLLLGDSQMRTSYNVMMTQKCDEWTILDYKEGSPSKSWCPPKPLKANKDPQPRMNVTACDGEFHVMGDGCWSGGAVWDGGEENGKVVYADVHSVADERYLHWNFLFEHRGGRNRTSSYDVVILATQLHDANAALGKHFANHPEKTPYGSDLSKRLKEIQTWHSGPILCVGTWATMPKQRGEHYWWVASLSRSDAYSSVSRRVAANLPNVWHLDLIRPTMLYRAKSADGVHLFYPKPMLQIAQILWHNVHALAQIT